jgi:hypothetical protein
MVMETKIQDQSKQQGGKQSGKPVENPLPGGRELVKGPVRGGLLGMDDEQLARALGWFSIGLGLAEVVAPRALSKLVGVKEDHDALVRVLGLREIASGIGILTQRRPAGWLWARVVGDAIDLACLSAALASPETNGGGIAAAASAVGGVMVADVICALQLSHSLSEDNETGETATTEGRPSRRSAAAGR